MKARVVEVAVLFTILANHFAAAVPFSIVPFPAWNVTSANKVNQDTRALSLPGVDTSKWLRLRDSKGTLMSTLIANGVHNEKDLFYSTNLQSVDVSQFKTPWFYRSEGVLGSTTGGPSYYTLKTNGISSRADIWLNGQRVVDKEEQAGAYVGLEYDVSDKLKVGEANVLLIKVYPTDYNRDFALGFVDWNPYPPDNGTGIWRDVELKRTGQITISQPRVKTTLQGDVSMYVNVKNLAGKASVAGHLDCSIQDPMGRGIKTVKKDIELGRLQQLKLELKTKIDDPQLWWPRQWGAQPLYTVQCNATIKGQNSISDSTTPTKFGIRTVKKTLNTKYNDTTFYVNDHPFQVLGAGYTSDIFLRFDEAKLRTQLKLVQDMGLNTIRLEGKQEHPYLYELCDSMGLMILAGWECCDKWEGWSYNDEGSGFKWTDADYGIANLSMRHEAAMMQSHPSMLGFLVGSDFWPDDRATKIYVDALSAFDWDAPIISAASQRGQPKQLGNGGMQMLGPYDYVPPNYWYDKQQRLGAAGGFGSELGAGVGTPELPSLKKFLAPSDLEDLWKAPKKGLYHMSTNVSSFYTRQIYNDALWGRYGAPSSLDDYLSKAQMADYEATRAQFEAYSSRWGKGFARPATGMIYWMLNNAWPSLHWNLFDYYGAAAGSYYGVKAAISKVQNAVYDYEERTVYLVDRRVKLEKGEETARTIEVDVMDLQGKSISKRKVEASTEPNAAKKVTDISGLTNNVTDPALLRVKLSAHAALLSRNVYWIAPILDVLDWDNSTWYHTPITKYSDLKAFSNMKKADVDISVRGKTVQLENKSTVPAVFVKLRLAAKDGGDVLPVMWEDNYVTLWPGEKMEVKVEFDGGWEGVSLEISGRNVGRKVVHPGV